LTSVGWTQQHIGLILTIGTLTALALQIPAGGLVDYVPNKRFLAVAAVVLVSASALLLALWPIFSVVVLAKILHASASCVLGPVLAAISLGLVGHHLLGARLGRNARYLSLGNAIAAAVMGGIGYYISAEAIFLFTAALSVPTLISLAEIRANDIDPDLARGELSHAPRVSSFALYSLVQNRPLIIFAIVALLFQCANAAALPIMAGALTMRARDTAPLIISICIFGPQIVVAVIAPWVGRKSESWGRRPLLALCFVALSIRCAVFTLTNDPFVVVAVQLFDGISAATLGVLIPLVIADVMRGKGSYNLAQGAVGVAIGIGASISTTLAGYIADTLGSASAFLLLSVVAATGLVFVLALMPETRDCHVR
jgi:MFS family permease